MGKGSKEESMEKSILALRLHMEGMMREMQLAIQELSSLTVTQQDKEKKRPKTSPMEFKDKNGRVFRI